MKIDPHCKMREVNGQHLVLQISAKSGDLNRLSSFNESALMLWNSLYGKEFELEDVTALLLANYEVENDVAQKDAEQWVETLKSRGIIL